MTELETGGRPRPRALIAEDHTLVREGLRDLLSPSLEVVALVEDGRALIAAAERLQPDVVLLDITMPQLNGLDAARHVARVCPGCRLIFVTMHAERDYLAAAFAVGAHAYVVKHSASSELLAAVQAVLRGESFVSRDIDLGPEGAPAPSKLRDALTPRQREVLQLVAEGKTARAIGELLGISRKTVEFHKASIMRLLGLRTTAELTRYALDHGIIGPP
jgi:DNA-binding NarL/FixJ family response regulator